MATLPMNITLGTARVERGLARLGDALPADERDPVRRGWTAAGILTPSTGRTNDAWIRAHLIAAGALRPARSCP